jgi:hypothetical protein
MPLTTYLADATLQFRVSRTGTDGAVATGPWRDWPLAQQGNVVGLTWELAQ